MKWMTQCEQWLWIINECESINILGIQLYGKQWQSIAELIDNKTEEQCRMYFYRKKKRLGLDAIYNKYRSQKVSDVKFLA